MSKLNKSRIRSVRRVRIKWEKVEGSEEGKWSIIKEMIIDKMALPGSTEIKSDVPMEKIEGLWFEATDDDDNLFYRASIPEPRMHEAELFDEDGTIYRQKADRSSFIFDVLMPDIPFVSKLKLYNRPKVALKKTLTRRDIKPVALLKARPSVELKKLQKELKKGLDAKRRVN